MNPEKKIPLSQLKVVGRSEILPTSKVCIGNASFDGYFVNSKLHEIDNSVEDPIIYHPDKGFGFYFKGLRLRKPIYFRHVYKHYEMDYLFVYEIVTSP